MRRPLVLMVEDSPAEQPSKLAMTALYRDRPSRLEGGDCGV